VECGRKYVPKSNHVPHPKPQNANPRHVCACVFLLSRESRVKSRVGILYYRDSSTGYRFKLYHGAICTAKSTQPQTALVQPACSRGLEIENITSLRLYLFHLLHRVAGLPLAQARHEEDARQPRRARAPDPGQARAARAPHGRTEGAERGSVVLQKAWRANSCCALPGPARVRVPPHTPPD
jgi:hypothetical protein